MVVSLLACALLPSGAAAQAEGQATRCPGRDASGRLEGLDPRDGSLHLSGGIVLRLADLRLDDGAAGEQARAVLLSLRGQDLRWRAGPPDRWGRAAAVALTAVAGGVDVADLLVAEGLAVVDPGEGDLLCEPRLLSVEAVARTRRLGVWREGAALDGNDANAVAARTGTYAVVEGRVVGVGERPRRTYLNLGRAGSGALTVTLSKRRWVEWQRTHPSAGSLRGRRIRARGLIEKWRSPMMEVDVVDVLQVVDEPSPESLR